MSFWNRPTDAAKKAVVAPMKVTNSSAVGDSWNRGEQRQTRNTPAVTMVAAWIRADTGVGPSMASGNHVCRKNWADLPMAPTNRKQAARARADQDWPANSQVVLALDANSGNRTSNRMVPNIQNTVMMPSANPKSPTRL